MAAAVRRKSDLTRVEFVFQSKVYEWEVNAITRSIHHPSG